MRQEIAMKHSFNQIHSEGDMCKVVVPIAACRKCDICVGADDAGEAAIVQRQATLSFLQ